MIFEHLGGVQVHLSVQMLLSCLSFCVIKYDLGNSSHIVGKVRQGQWLQNRFCQ